MATTLAHELTAFYDALTAGLQPDANAFAARLPSAELRQFFLGAVERQASAAAAQKTPLSQHMLLAQRYELQEPIGSGGMGQVWRARDLRLGHEVAIKVLNPMAMTAFDVDQVVAREGKILAKLSHPGVVRVLDAGRDGDYRFLVMDLVGGMALDRIIDELRAARQQGKALGGKDLLDLVGPPAPGRDAVVTAAASWPIAACRVFVELLRTLEATHGVGVVHRDLKPGNVRLIGGGAPVLLDFGMGFLAGGTLGTITVGMFGTAPYAAPEQWEGVDCVGLHTDVYQAGVVLYELLTLERCFPDASAAATMQAVREGRYQRPREHDATIDGALEACVLRAMDVDPTRRYRTAAEFRQDLERVLAGTRPAAAALLDVASRSARRFVRRHRTALLLAAAAGAGALGFWLAREPWPAVTAKSPVAVTVDVPQPARMVAYRVARDATGVYCSPVTFALAPGERPALSRRVPRGATEVALQDIGDSARVAGSIVSAIFVDEANTAANATFEKVVGAMQQARLQVERRDGAWLLESEFLALFERGRGSAGVDLPVHELLQLGRWRQQGLTGVTISP